MKKPQISIIGLSGQSIFMSVDEFHKNGETLSCKELFIEPGGKGYNQAIAGSKLGAYISFLSAVGFDSYAKVCEDELIKNNIVTNLIYKKNENTSLATILTNKHGDNQVTVYSGAKLEVNDVIDFETEIINSDILLLQNEVPHEVNLKAIEIANKYNIKVVLNPAPATSIPIDWIDKIWLLTPNELEAKTIFNLDQNARLDELKENIKTSSLKRIIITLGKDGSLVYENGEFTHIEAINIDSVDSTGAGDCFNSALVIKIALNNSLVESAMFANVASGLSVNKKHVLDSLPTSEEVELYIKKI